MNTKSTQTPESLGSPICSTSSIQEILDADTGDSSLIFNLANRGRRMEVEIARMRKALSDCLPFIETMYGSVEKIKPVLLDEINGILAGSPANSVLFPPVLFDWKVWNNWEGPTLEAVDMLNVMLRHCGVKIKIEWDPGNDYTEVSILRADPNDWIQEFESNTKIEDA
jgi:hypothetical protein